MTPFGADLKLAFRRLRKSPSFALAAILTLSLGMGGAVTLFTIAHGVLIKPLPYPDSGRLVALRTVSPSGGHEISAPMLWDLQTHARTLDQVAIQRPRGFELSTRGRPERIPALEVSAGYFEVLGYQPELGRFFQRPDEDEGQSSVIIGHGLWMRAFGGDPAIVGSAIQVGRRARTVLGVAPKDVELPWNRSADVFVPVDRRDDDTAERLNYNYTALGRLKPGVNLAAARSEMSAIFQGWLKQYPKMPPEVALTAEDLQSFLLGTGFRPVALLMVAVCLLLLIACTNVAGLFLARALGRQHDVAMRRALGATKRHLFRQNLSEGLWVGLLGGVCSLPLVTLALRFVPLWLPGAASMNGTKRLSVDGGALAWMLLFGLAASTFLALVPMIQTRSVDLQRTLRSRGSGRGAGSSRLRTGLIGGQVALTVMLLVSSGLLLRSMTKLLRTDPGFDMQHVVAFAVRLPTDGYAAEAKRTRFQSELAELLRSIPGVEAVGSSHIHPLSGGEGSTSFRLLGSRGEARDTARGVSVDIVGPDYFKAMGIPILKGRPVQASDTAQAPRVVVVNESFARAFLKGDPIGQRLSGGWRSETTPNDTPLEIVGVAGDIRNALLDTPPVPKVMYAWAQMPYFGKSFELHTSLPPSTLRAAVQEKVAQLDPMLPVLAYGSLQTRAAMGVAARRQTALLLASFSVMALLLSGIGIYGTVAYLVARRTSEIGIRKALGAQVPDILRGVLLDGGRMITLGTLLGLSGTVLAGRLLSSQLYGVTQHDSVAILGSVLALGLTCLVACLVPAIRAASVDPTVALRDE